jgi:tRNA threonylcarbamoyladenosine biosynthesis protein TsaB
MNILAFDSSGAACSVAVLRSGSVAAQDRREMARGHAEALMPMVRDCLRTASLSFDALDLIAVTVGPGAFTGIRIALAAARGLSLASGVPVLGLTAFETVTAAVPVEAVAGSTLIVALDSRRDDLFVQFFAAGEALGPGAAIAPADLAAAAPAGELVVAGDAAPRAVAALQRSGRKAWIAGTAGPDAVALARLAARRWRPGMVPDLPRPLYLRAPGVTMAPGRTLRQ